MSLIFQMNLYLKQNCGVSLNTLHYVLIYAELLQVNNAKTVLLSAPDVIPKNLKGVGTWRNNMEISWEVTWMASDSYLKFLIESMRAEFVVHLMLGVLSMCSASSLQRLERTPPKVPGVVEKERLQRGVEERNHQMVKVLHIWCWYLHSIWPQSSGCEWLWAGSRVFGCDWVLWRRP